MNLSKPSAMPDPRPARFVTHPVFRRPGFGKHHPLSGDRQGAVIRLCEALGWLDASNTAIAPLAERGTLERFHTPPYLDALQAAAAGMSATPEVRARYNLGTMECPLFDGLMQRARASVGGSILAAELALEGVVAFHPGGGTHHGRPDRASGFCYLNDPVFAILTLLDAGLGRVLYVDLDAHHGDGVELAFAGDPRVFLVSIHETGRWPGTGTRAGRIGDRILNIPVPRGFTDSELGLLVAAVLLPHASRTAPEAMVVALGADGLAGDPLSAMQLSNTALWQATEAVLAAVPRGVVLGGGGYNPWTTARLWAGQWGRLAQRPLPALLPPAASDVLAALRSDLVDDEDISPAWLDRLADPISETPARAELVALAEQCGGRQPCGV